MSLSSTIKCEIEDKVLKVAVFGGSFNPFHSGHHQIISYLALVYDEVVVIPTNMKYYKHDCEMFSFEERCKAVERRFERLDNVRVDRVECDKGERWKFIDSLKHVMKVEQEKWMERRKLKCEFYVAMGSDCFQDFKNWYGWREILTLAKLVVFTRPGCMDKVPEDIECKFVSMNNDDSSTKIRARLMEERN